MTISKRWILGLILGGLVAVSLIWFLLEAMWFQPVSILRSKVEQAQARVQQYDDALRQAGVVQAGLNSYVDRTLGDSLEAVDHHLRTKLNRLGESIGLQNMSVGTSPGEVALSPGRNDFRGETRRALREEVDFVEVEGTLSGTTTWVGAIELVDRLRHAPWINKIDSVRLRGGQASGRIDITIRLRTLFFPNQSAAEDLVDDWSRDRMVAYASLVRRDPFVIPSPPPPPPRRPAARPSSERPPPPAWQITGVAGIGGRAEVWLRNVRTGQTRRLEVGQTHQGMLLEGVTGDQVSFRHGESTVSIRVGEMLKHTTSVHK